MIDLDEILRYNPVTLPKNKLSKIEKAGPDLPDIELPTKHYILSSHTTQCNTCGHSYRVPQGLLRAYTVVGKHHLIYKPEAELVAGATVEDRHTTSWVNRCHRCIGADQFRRIVIESPTLQPLSLAMALAPQGSSFSVCTWDSQGSTAQSSSNILTTAAPIVSSESSVGNSPEESSSS